MCGRFSITVDVEEIQGFFTFNAKDIEYKSRWNIAPTNQILTYGARGIGSVEYMRWGLIPRWWNRAKLKPPLSINARSENVRTSPMFRESFRTRRCLILADSYYEWKHNDDGTRTPFRIGLSTWQPFAFAGLYDECQMGNLQISSCTIITTQSNDLIEPIHARMPVILEPGEYATWLDQNICDYGILSRMLLPCDPSTMAMYEISSAIGNVRNDAPYLIEALSN